jgi:hypothetical protein
MGLTEGKLYPIIPTDKSSGLVWFKGVKNAETGVVEPKPIDRVQRDEVLLYARNYISGHNEFVLKQRTATDKYTDIAVPNVLPKSATGYLTIAFDFYPIVAGTKGWENIPIGSTVNADGTLAEGWIFRLYNFSNDDNKLTKSPLSDGGVHYVVTRQVTSGFGVAPELLRFLAEGTDAFGGTAKNVILVNSEKIPSVFSLSAESILAG